MRELNTFYLNKRTLNSGYVFVNDIDSAMNLKNLFKDMKIEYTMYINKESTCVYGFKVFRIKRKLFELCAGMKEVVAKC